MARDILINFGRLFLFLVLLAAAILQFRVALFEQSEFSEVKSESSLHSYQRNPRLLTWLAKQKHMFEADMVVAETLFQQALTASALYIPAWLGLAELKKDEGNQEEADAILEYVDTLTGAVKRWRWDKALVAYQLGREDILARDLAYIIREIPGKMRSDACRMAISVWPDADLLRTHIGFDNMNHLFLFSVREKRVDEAIALWPFINVDGDSIRDADIYAFLNRLIADEKLSLAAKIWKQRYNPDSLLFNGSFSIPPLQAAFGWRILKQKGVTWRIDSSREVGGGNALRIHFDRKSNIKFHHVYQIVPLAGGLQYRLKGQIKTTRLTTDQLPFMEVYGYKCQAPYVQTEMVEQDQPWTPFELVFNVPQECETMLIRLRRKESTFFDNVLAGDIWLKELEINETGERYVGQENRQ